MFNYFTRKIESYKQVKWLFLFTWVPIKLFIAYLLIENSQFGLYIVIGYILFSLENQAGLLFINSQESNHHFSNIYNKTNNEPNSNQELEDMKLLINDIDLRLNDVETIFEED